MLTSSLVCLVVLSAACQQEEGYDCTASFYAQEGGDLLETKEYAYDDAGDADEAKSMCMADAEADKPEGATSWSCFCESR